MRIDLSADVGEGHDDLAIFPFVTSVSIGCGAHAGDEETMDRSLAEAARHGVVAGAHPGYPDREGFGRRAVPMAPDELHASLVEQISALAGIAARRAMPITHVKTHGALYNRSADDPALAEMIAGSVRAVDPALRLVGLAGSLALEAATRAGLAAVAEAFADRRYFSNGRLASREHPEALIADPEEAAAQAVAIALGRAIETLDGPGLRVDAQTICVHADTPGPVEIAREVRRALERAGVRILAVEA